MDPMDFKQLYNQKMPSKSDPVVFSCLAGTRSKQALGFAMSLGFSRYEFVCKDGINAASPIKQNTYFEGKGKNLHVKYEQKNWYLS